MNVSKLGNKTQSKNKTKKGKKNLTRDEQVALWNAIEANLTKAQDEINERWLEIANSSAQGLRL